MAFGWCLTAEDQEALALYRADLRAVVGGYLPSVELDRLDAALEVAFQAHNGQVRRSGERFVEHPIEVTKLLAALGMDSDTLVAGLLHDTVEDTTLQLVDIEGLFGKDVRRIVEGETKVSKLTSRAEKFGTAALGQPPASTAALAEPTTPACPQQANLRAMLVAMSEDWRVLVVKLCDRLHNMRTLGSMPLAKQRRIAAETLDIFAPLAHRLGIWSIKAELEDRSFKVLDPPAYAALQRRLRDEWEAHKQLDIECARIDLEVMSNSELGEQIGWVRTSLRAKELYVVHRNQGRGDADDPRAAAAAEERSAAAETDPLWFMNIVFDPRSSPATPADGGMRASSAIEEEQLLQEGHHLCYCVLEVLHSVFPPVLPPRIKDYIAFPKSNGYSALHTVVWIQGRAVEVHIRTASMDRRASFGMAAAWMEQAARRQQRPSVSPPVAPSDTAKGDPAVVARQLVEQNSRRRQEAMRAATSYAAWSMLRDGFDAPAGALSAEDDRGMLQPAIHSDEEEARHKAAADSPSVLSSDGYGLEWLRGLGVLTELPSPSSTTTDDAAEFAKTVRAELESGRRFVFTPHGQILNLKGDATVRDAVVDLLMAQGYSPWLSPMNDDGTTVAWSNGVSSPLFDEDNGQELGPPRNPGKAGKIVTLQSRRGEGVPPIILTAKVNGRIASMQQRLRDGDVVAMTIRDDVSPDAPDADTARARPHLLPPPPPPSPPSTATATGVTEPPAPPTREKLTLAAAPATDPIRSATRLAQRGSDAAPSSDATGDMAPPAGESEAVSVGIVGSAAGWSMSAADGQATPPPRARPNWAAVVGWFFGWGRRQRNITGGAAE